MKRYLMTLLAALAFACGAYAMDYETAREQAYYLTDKMAYELNLNDQQYNDAYEINLDYLLSLNTEADVEAIYLEHRNADLRYILYDWQWRAFMAADYFYRPVWWYRGGWYFPIFRHYTHGYYFYHRPHIFWDYRGAHGRRHYMNGSFYANRRPEWHGGLRGQGEHMVGHPNGERGGRYGTPGNSRGGRIDNGRTRGGSLNDRAGNSRTPNAGYNNRMDNTRTRGTGTMQNGSRENGRGAGTYSRGGDNNMRSSSRTTVGGSSRGTTVGGSSRGTSSFGGSSRSSVGGGSSRGSMGGSSRSGSGFSGGSRSSGGFSGGGRSGGGFSGGGRSGGGRR